MEGVAPNDVPTSPQRSWPKTACWLVVLASLAHGASGCGARQTPPANPDQWVPPTEPRATLVVRLDLPLSVSPPCDEVFDLALYADRAIDLITWDAARGRCLSRVAHIRYLPSRTTRQAVWHEVRERSLKSEVLSK